MDGQRWRDGVAVPQATSPDAALFASAKRHGPGRPLASQAQVISTKTVVIYGTGRRQWTRTIALLIYALDKATGKSAPWRFRLTSAVPMTFMHKGSVRRLRHWRGRTTALVALALPK